MWHGLHLLGGAQVTTVDVLPTPAVAWLAAESGRPAAMITASHNPWQDNGVKFFAPGGLLSHRLLNLKRLWPSAPKSCLNMLP